jgi:hypothetical protein
VGHWPARPCCIFAHLLHLSRALIPSSQEEKPASRGLPVKTLTGQVVFEPAGRQPKASQMKLQVRGVAVPSDTSCMSSRRGRVGEGTGAVVGVHYT